MNKKKIHYKNVFKKYNIKEEGILTPNEKICKCGKSFSRKMIKCPNCEKKLRNKDCHIIETIQRYDYKEDSKKLTYYGYEVLFDEVKKEFYEEIILKFEFNKLTGKTTLSCNKFEELEYIPRYTLDCFDKDDNFTLYKVNIKDNKYEKKEVFNQFVNFLYKRFFDSISFETLEETGVTLEAFLYIFFKYRGIFNSIFSFLNKNCLYLYGETLIKTLNRLNFYFPDIDFNDSKNDSQFLLLKFLCIWNEIELLDKLCLLIKNYPKETERLGSIFDKILEENLEDHFNDLFKMILNQKISLQQIINLYENLKINDFIRIGNYYDNYVNFYHSTPNLNNVINGNDIQKMQQKVCLSRHYPTNKIEKAYSLLNKNPMKALEYLVSE